MSRTGNGLAGVGPGREGRGGLPAGGLGPALPVLKSPEGHTCPALPSWAKSSVHSLLSLQLVRPVF